MTDTADRPPPPPDDRPQTPTTGDERTLLDAWLDQHRATLLWKCAGLTPEQLAQRSVPPSTLSLLGLARHMADVERSWFAGWCGGDTTRLYSTDDDPDHDFTGATAGTAAADLAVYRAEVETCRALLVDHDLDETQASQRTGEEYNLRWIYLHMIEEYARHNGHADLLRETIDGVIGD